MKRRTAIALTSLFTLCAIGVDASMDPPKRPKRLVRFKVENVDGKLVVTPAKRITHYVKLHDGTWVALGLEPVDEREFIGPKEAK